MWRNNLFIQLVFLQTLLGARYILQDVDPALQSFVLINNLSGEGGGSSEIKTAVPWLVHGVR